MSNNKKLALSFAVRLIIGASMGLYFQSSLAADHVVFWNKLGSDSEITQSEVGPGGTKTAGSFVAGPFANFGQAYLNSSSNTLALTFPANSVIPKSRGTIAFWAKLNNFPSALFNGVAFLQNGGSSSNPTFHWRIGFGTNNGCGGSGLYGSVGVATNPYCQGVVDTATQSGTFDSILGDRAAWHHYAIVWDEAGISSLGGRKTYIYLDGNLVNTSYYWDGSPWGNIPSGSRFALAYFFNITGVSVAVDNIVVWNYVKTNFADRIFENPLPALYARVVSPSSISLAWQDTATTEKGFRIERKLGNCSSANAWATLVDLPANSSDFSDTGLTANTQYSYRVSAYYGGQEFAYYKCTSATTAGAGIAKIPTDLNAESKSSTQINLAWNDNSTNETSFAIYRKFNTNNWALLKTTAANVQSYNDTTAAGNTSTNSYYYDVRSCNTTGCARANSYPLVVPFSPASLSASVAATVQLNWSDKSNNERGFQIWRKNGACTGTSPWIFAKAVPANTTTYNDSSAISGVGYAYKVRAYYKTPTYPYSFGYSGFSNCVAATAP